MDTSISGMWSAVLFLGAFAHKCMTRHGPPIQELLRPDLVDMQPMLTQDLIEWHKNFTEIESITYNEKDACEWLASSLESQGYHVEKQYVEEEPARFNVYAYPGKTRETKVLVSSHIDTVRLCPLTGLKWLR